MRSKSQHRELVEKAVSFVTTKDSALDIGAGSMNDSKFLLKKGFKRVTAIDNDEAAQEYAKKIKSKNFKFVRTTFQNFEFKENFYDLISAQYALPYLAPTPFKNVMRRIFSSLKKDGIFCGQLFGDRDTWNIKGSGKTFFEYESALNLFKNMEILFFESEENDKKLHLEN